MVHGKNQHFVPQFYFRNFSSDGTTICLFNLKNKRFIYNANIKGQCSDDYFYSRDTSIETVFSSLEGSTREIISKIIEKESLSEVNEEQKQHLKSNILLQHGRTQYARESEEEMANALLNYIVPQELKGARIESTLRDSVLISMLSGPLLSDLKIVLLENKTQTEFIFSDNPVVFYNSFFNDKVPHGTQGFASTGLQIYFPLSPRFALLIFDEDFYEISQSEKITILKDSDIQRLNGLQIIFCNEHIYFGNPKMQGKVLEKYKQIKSKRPGQKTINQVVGSRANEDGTHSELWHSSSPKIKYNLENLTFLKHKKTDSPYGMRNLELVEFHYKFLNAFDKGKIKSEEDMGDFFKSLKNRRTEFSQ